METRFLNKTGLKAHPSPWPARRASAGVRKRHSAARTMCGRATGQTQGARGTERTTGSSRAGGHGGICGGLGRASWANLTMVLKSSAHKILPHSSRQGLKGREAGNDASRITVGGGASVGAPLQPSATYGGSMEVPF